MAAALSGQVIVIPPGSYAVHTRIDTIRNKRLVLVCYGTIYCNKRTFLRIYPATTGSPYKQHDVRIYGDLIGAANLPAHTKNGAVRTGPDWTTLTGAALELRNRFRDHFEINRISGFYYGIDNQVDKTGAFGAQENTFSAQIIEQCSVDFAARSLDGDTYWDKNVLTGIHGGTLRLSGGLAIKFDGYSSAAASNGEVYNGAFTSNKFQNVLVESVDSVFEMNGSITETMFDHVLIEAGSNTGVYSDNVFQFRSVSPNFVRGSTFISCGFIYQRWLTNATFGFNGKFVNTPFYTGNAILIGSDAIVDGNGNVVIEKVPTLAQSVIAALPSIVKVVNQTGQQQDDVSISTSTYTVAAGIKYLIYTSAGGTVTLPTASSNVKRDIYIKNSSAGSVNISGADVATLAAGQTLMFHSNGSNWYGL
jgi:hypothetical protein